MRPGFGCRIAFCRENGQAVSMKLTAIIQEVEAAKDRLAEQAGSDLRRFLDQIHAWEAEHPHAGPVLLRQAKLAV